MQSLWKTVQKFLKKLKIELPYDLAISLLGIYSKEMKTVSALPCLLQHQSELWRHGKNETSINRWMGKDDLVYIYNGTLFNHVEWGNTPICNNIDTWGHYTMWNKSDRERQILQDVIYMWNFFKKLNSLKKRVEKWGK